MELKHSGNLYYHYLFKLISYYKDFLQNHGPTQFYIDMNELFENSASQDPSPRGHKHKKIQKLKIGKETPKNRDFGAK